MLVLCLQFAYPGVCVIQATLIVVVELFSLDYMGTRSEEVHAMRR